MKEGSSPAYGSLGRVAFYAAVVVVMAAAVPNGTVEVWHKSIIISAIALVGLIRVIDGVVGGELRIAEPVILAPMLGLLLFAVVQILPSPLGGETISVDPYETRSFILVFGSLIVFAEVLFNYALSIRGLKALAGVVVATAVCSALFGILWELLAAADFNVLALYIRPHEGYAQFINRNHFAVLVEMALGVLLGLLLKAELSEKNRLFGWLAVGMLIYSLVAASSRGGLVSLAGLSAFAGILHVYTKRSDGGRRRSRTSAFGRLRMPSPVRKALAASGIILMVAGLVTFIVAFVGGDQLVSRFEKVDNELTANEHHGANRNLIWRSTVDLIAAKPLLGAGFGAYATAITEFDHANGRAAIKQAHNEYLEILANGGVVGFLFFAAFAVLVLARMRKNITSVDGERGAYAFGALIGIFGVIVHNFVDFGLHVMVNALLFLVLIVIGVADVKGPTLTRAKRFFEPGVS